MARKSKHGGRRSGAGRPPVEGARVSRAISFRVSVDERTRGEALAAAENVAIGELARRAYLARLAEVPPAGPPECAKCGGDGYLIRRKLVGRHYCDGTAERVP